MLEDLQVPEHVAGCRTVYYYTGPLCRVLEMKSVSILDMDGRFQKLLTYLDKWALDASELLSGEAILFDDFSPMIYDTLLTPNTNDDTTQEILQVLCSAFSALVSCLVSDHLPDGRYGCPSANLKVATKFVPKTNTISEF